MLNVYSLRHAYARYDRSKYNESTVRHNSLHVLIKLKLIRLQVPAHLQKKLSSGSKIQMETYTRVRPYLV